MILINNCDQRILLDFFFFFFKQKTAYEMLRSLVGSEMCIRDSNSIEGRPSSRVLSAPGGSSSISIGADIDTSTAMAANKSDEAALAFLQETNGKVATGGKLSVRDFHMIGSFPLFESVYTEQRISSMSYAEKVANGNKLMRCLNEMVGTAAQPAPVAQQQVQQQQPVMQQQPVQQQGGISFDDGSTGMARTQCVGGVADNSIGDIPSVKVHHAPGGQSSLASGGATMAMLGGVDESAVQFQQHAAEPATRTRCTGGTADNAIGSVPSVRVHNVPGGSSSISFGGDEPTSAAPSSDKADTNAIAFLQEANAKFSANGKLSVRDFHMFNSFPMFEPICTDMRMGDMSYAEKVNSTSRLLTALNAFVGETATRPVLQPVTNATAAPGQCDGPSRTKCVGGVADNTIGEVPSVKIHHAPGGSSSIQLW
eukprot:TRINITY_DN6654_c0_g2_i4.p1 TRINITY_DN6654_c0_g2~~TRINITY_DN6654_c0_g2_i4.p1  ORF type:complete len:425 (+),score=145.50 TRINITY_DN6654_c0_g2_i4:81-1355(+)